MDEQVDPDDFLTQAATYFAAMGTPLKDASEIPEVPDAHEEFIVTLTRAEIAALLPLIRVAQLRTEVDGDPWGRDQQQWWAISRARLEKALGTDGQAGQGG